MGKSLKSLKKQVNKKTTGRPPAKPAKPRTAPQRVLASQTESQLFPFPKEHTPTPIERLMDPPPVAWDVVLHTMNADTLSTSFLMVDNPLDTGPRMSLELLPEKTLHLKRPLRYQSTLSIIESLHHRAFKGAIFEFSNS